MLGCLTVSVKIQLTSVQTEFYIVKKGIAIQGKDLFAAPNLYVFDSLITTVPFTLMQSVSKGSSLSNTSLGCVKKNFVHKIKHDQM